MDAVEKAGSGHPGTAMSLAPAAYLLFQRTMRHDPTDPSWVGRDRFVLSCGHSSLTLYIQLYLSGYGLTLDDLKSLRQADSLTPGHPEHGHTAGVETTTGPLGQGLGNAVGMAMAARRERGLFDPDAAPGASPFDHHIWCMVSDEDIEALHQALEAARAETDRPSFIKLRTIIGWPAPNKKNTGKIHGSALGAAEVAATKQVMGMDPEKSFDVPEQVLAHARAVVE